MIITEYHTKAVPTTPCLFNAINILANNNEINNI